MTDNTRLNQNKNIRETITSTPFGENLLKMFEKSIMEVEFIKFPVGYHIQKKGGRCILNSVPCRTIAEIDMFMYGMLTYHNKINNLEDTI